MSFIPFQNILMLILSEPLEAQDANPYKPRVLLVGHQQTADPDQTPQNAVSDQGLHGLLTDRMFC